MTWKTLRIQKGAHRILDGKADWRGGRVSRGQVQAEEVGCSSLMKVLLSLYCWVQNHLLTKWAEKNLWVDDSLLKKRKVAMLLLRTKFTCLFLGLCLSATEFYHAVQAGLDRAVSLLPQPPSTGVTGVYCHARLVPKFLSDTVNDEDAEYWLKKAVYIYILKYTKVHLNHYRFYFLVNDIMLTHGKYLFFK